MKTKSPLPFAIASSRTEKMKREKTAKTVTFAERLTNVMLQRRPPLTQKVLAERVGVTRAAVSRWVRQNRFPYPRHLNKICAILGVRRQWLETGEGEKWLPKPNMPEEIRTGYTRREKLAFIEDRFPEALPMLDVFLDSVVKGGVREVLGNHR